MSGSSKNSLTNDSLAIAIGKLPGKATFDKFGDNSAIGTSFEDIWNQGGTLVHLSSAETMNIVSTSTADDGAPAGTGAQTLKVLGLDNNYNEISETITLNGTTNVLTSNSYLRVHTMYVITAGSGQTNAGVITATASAAATVQGHVTIGYGRTTQCMYTVPAGKTLYIKSLTVSVEKSKDIEVHLDVRKFGEIFVVRKVLRLFEAAADIIIDHGIPILEKSDFRIKGKTSAGTVGAAAEVVGILVDNG